MFLMVLVLTCGFAAGEYGTIDNTHSDTPLLDGYVIHIEADESGDLIFVGYFGYSGSDMGKGFSIIDRSAPSIRHYNTTTTPPLANDYMVLMEYDQADSRLILLTMDPYETTLYLEILNVADDTITSTPLEISDPYLNDMEYDPITDVLYIGTDYGLFIIDVDTATTIRNFDTSNGLMGDEVIRACIDPQERVLWILVDDYYSGHIQSVNLDDQQLLEENFTIFDYATTAGFSPYEVESFIYDPATREFYVSFESLYREDDGHTYYLSYFSRDDPYDFKAINTSISLEGYPYMEYEGEMIPGSYILSMATARGGDYILFTMGDLGVGIIHCSDHSYRAPLWDGYDPYGGISLWTYFTGGLDIAYCPDTDTAWAAGISGILFFGPDDIITEGGGEEAEKIEPQKVDMVSLYAIEKGEEEESQDVDSDTRLGPRDMLHVSAYAPYITDTPIDHMELKIIKEPGGEVVYEKKEEGNSIDHEQDVKELPTSRSTVKVLAKDAQGNTIYEDESTFYVDNPVSKPIVSTVVGAGIALTASLGAGIAISTLGAGASSAAGGAASSAAAGTASSASSSAVGSSFSWKNLLFGFASEYGEETLKEKTPPKDRFLDLKGSFITKREVVAMLISVIVLVVGFGYVEMMSALAPNRMIEVLGIPLFTLPNFSLTSFFMVVPVVFFTSALIILAIELVEELSAKMIGLWSEFRIWPIGLITLLISSIFLMPIGYPGKAVPKGEVRITNRMEAFISSCVLMSILAMMFPFEIAFLIGDSLKAGLPADLLTSFGMIGITMCVMMFAYSVFPIVPMDGRKLWKFNKFYLIVMLLFGITTFGLWSFRLLPNPIFWKGDYVIYIPTWILAAVFMGISALAMVGLIGLVILGFTLKNWDDPKPKKKVKKKEIEE